MLERFEPTERTGTKKLLRRGRRTVELADADLKAACLQASTDLALDERLRLAIASLTDALDRRDWRSVAEGTAYLQQAELDLRDLAAGAQARRN